MAGRIAMPTISNIPYPLLRIIGHRTLIPRYVLILYCHNILGRSTYSKICDAVEVRGLLKNSLIKDEDSYVCLVNCEANFGLIAENNYIVIA